MSFEDVVQNHFPGAMPEEVFVRRLAVTLIQDHGFSPASTLACVGVCRDELCRSLTDECEAMWGEPFDCSSLGGMLTLGRSGLAAARDHAPIVNGRTRYAFLVFSHVGVGAGGELGVVERPGRTDPAPACDVLEALLADLQSGERSPAMEWQDPEHSLLRLRVRQLRDLSEAPDLIEVTKAVFRAAVTDLQALMVGVFDRQNEDIAVVAGVQIHGPDRVNLVWPGVSFVVVEGRRSEIWF